MFDGGIDGDDGNPCRAGRGENDTWRVKKMCSVRFLMVKTGFTMCFPCLAKASDKDVLSVCRGWTLSRLINMPSHAASTG